jgi:hypothetical protein
MADLNVQSVAPTVQSGALTVPLGYPSLETRLRTLRPGASLMNPYGKVNVADVLETLSSKPDRRDFATEESDLDDDELMEVAYDEVYSQRDPRPKARP